MPAWWTRASLPKKASKKQNYKEEDSARNASEPESDKSKRSPCPPLSASPVSLTPAQPKDIHSNSSQATENDLWAGRMHRLPRPVASSGSDQVAYSSVSSGSWSSSCSDIGFPVFREIDGFETPTETCSQHDYQRQDNRKLLSSSPTFSSFDNHVCGSTLSNKNGISSSLRTSSDLCFSTAVSRSFSPPRISGDKNISSSQRSYNTNPSLSPSPSYSLAPTPGSISPVPGSRAHSVSTSPLQSRPVSPRSKQDETKLQCHPLPLPPSFSCSPTSLSQNGSAISCISPTPTSSKPMPSKGCTSSSSYLKSRWKKGRLLGRGTFGHVYAGFDSESGQLCAIKEVKVVSDDKNSKECLRQLNQEISLLSQLSHPNIVRYYGSEMDGDTLSVYLEYVSGGSIHKLLQEYGSFKEQVIRNYTAQILPGLTYLHKRNTVHRDIKGANILVDSNGIVKLADFGLAKHIDSSSTPLSFRGSPYWMAPEIIINTTGYNWAVDIWSLGCTIIEMATSKPPWIQYEGVAAIFKIGNSKEIPPIPDSLSDDGKNFVKLCLQRDPSARPTAGQLLEHPFVRDQVIRKVLKNKNSHTDPEPSLPYAIHSLSTPMQRGIHSHRNTRTSPIHADYRPHHSVGGYPTLCREPGVRKNMSLPVSPSTSPLRQFGSTMSTDWLSSPNLSPIPNKGENDRKDHVVFPRVQLNSIHLDPDVYRMMVAMEGSQNAETGAGK